MSQSAQRVCILVAEDDADDRILIRDAFRECRLANELQFVEDGEQLLDYLHRRGSFSDPARTPAPGLILIDLNMPRKDGREALREIKADAQLKRIPVVVLTTSKADEDIVRTYELGASSFITKPVSFAGLVQVMKTLGDYWLEMVKLPPRPDKA